jgi:hypothetical protein
LEAELQPMGTDLKPFNSGFTCFPFSFTTIVAFRMIVE